MKWHRRLWIHVTADRRKFTVFCLMSTVGLLLWARLLIVSDIPRTAIAEPDEVHPDRTAFSEDQVVFEEIPDGILVVLDDLPDRDPFAIDGEYFPDETSPGTGSIFSEESDPDGDNGGLLPDRSLQQIVEEHVRGLRVEAVMPRSDLAVIDGQVLGAGDTLEGLDLGGVPVTLVEVIEDTVVLACKQFHFFLTLDAPDP